MRSTVDYLGTSAAGHLDEDEQRQFSIATTGHTKGLEDDPEDTLATIEAFK